MQRDAAACPAVHCALCCVHCAVCTVLCCAVCTVHCAVLSIWALQRRIQAFQAFAAFPPLNNPDRCKERRLLQHILWCSDDEDGSAEPFWCGDFFVFIFKFSFQLINISELMYKIYHQRNLEICCSTFFEGCDDEDGSAEYVCCKRHKFRMETVETKIETWNYFSFCESPLHLGGNQKHQQGAVTSRIQRTGINKNVQMTRSELQNVTDMTDISV